MNPVKTAHTLDLVRRARRLRRTSGIRSYVRETRLSADQFLYPLFVMTGTGVRREVPSMPGVFQLSVDEAVRETEAARADGVPGVLLFGLPAKKDDVGSGAYDSDAPVQSAVRAIKRSSPDTVVVTDVCLCEYTSHGHCGILEGHDVANDVTVDQLVRAAVSHATAGADIVAPSDMMDGRVGAIQKSARRARLRRSRDHVVRRQVLLGVLRAVPRRRRLGSAVRRPPHAPDGSRQCGGSAARSRAGHRGRRGHRHGEAGDAVPRHRAPREGHVRLSDGGLSGER